MRGITIRYARALDYAKYFVAGALIGFAVVKAAKVAYHNFNSHSNQPGLASRRNHTSSRLLEEMLLIHDILPQMQRMQAIGAEECGELCYRHPYFELNGVTLGKN